MACHRFRRLVDSARNHCGSKVEADMRSRRREHWSDDVNADAGSPVKQTSIYSAFVCTVALFAAVLGDLVVESVSNAQILWRGNYTDRSSLDLLPVFLLAVTALVLTNGLLLLAQARESGLSTRSLILSTSRALRGSEIARLLPAIFAAQLFVLFCMETTEQVVVYGHALGGTLWLGGPVAISLSVHALFGVAAAFGLAKTVSALAEAITRIVTCIVARFVECSRSTVLLLRKRIAFTLALIVIDSLVERGPPRLARTRSGTDCT